MPPEASAILAVLCGLFVIGTGIWYFLPDKTKKFLTFLWKIYERYSANKAAAPKEEPKEKKGKK